MAVYKFASQEIRDQYSTTLSNLLNDQPHCPDDSIDNNWKTLHSCVITAAKETIGRGKRKQPEWFTDSKDVLAPLIEEKNRAFERFLQSSSSRAKNEFRKLQRKVKKAVDKARDQWIAKVAADGEAAVKDGKTRWESIRKLQRAFAGRRSVRPNAVKKLDGELAEGEAEVLQRWQQHFSSLLNTQSTVDDQVLNDMPSHPVCSEFDELPTEEELEEAISSLRKARLLASLVSCRNCFSMVVVLCGTGC